MNNPNCVGFQITTSNYEPAGLATELHTANFLAAFPTTAVCPPDHPQCGKYSNPVLANNIFWQNRAFKIGVATPGGPVQLAPALSQTATGSCPTGATYWDIGVYNDTAANNHASGLTLSPTYSLLTDAADYPGGNNLGLNPNVVHQYCNGSRVPAEIAPQLCTGPNGNANAPGCIQPGTVGLQMTVPPGVPDTTPPPLAAFTLTPAATVDEGSNWINMFYGPLSLSNPTAYTASGIVLPPLANYAPASGSPAINYIPTGASDHPSRDFFGNPRPDPSDTTHFDIGAVEVQGTGGTAGTPVLTSIAPASGVRGASVAVTLTGTGLTGATSVNAPGSPNITVSSFVAVNDTTVTATLNIAAATTLGAHNITVTAGGTPSNAVTFTVVAPTLASIAPSSGARGTSVPVTITGIGLTGATSVNAPGSPNITVSNFVAVNDTTVTATLNIAATTTLGAHNITVTVNGTTSNAVTFTVVGPALTSITPNNGGRGTVVAVTLTGTNLTGTTAVTVSGTGVTASAVTVVNATTVTANLTITATASLTARNVSVTTNGATSNTLTGAFTVHP